MSCHRCFCSPLAGQTSISGFPEGQEHSEAWWSDGGVADAAGAAAGGADDGAAGRQLLQLLRQLEGQLSGRSDSEEPEQRPWLWSADDNVTKRLFFIFLRHSYKISMCYKQI